MRKITIVIAKPMPVLVLVVVVGWRIVASLSRSGGPAPKQVAVRAGVDVRMDVLAVAMGQ